VDVLSTQLQQANFDLEELIKRWQLDKNAETEAALQQAFADLFSKVLCQCVETIEGLAKQQQVAYRDFYSTLLIAAHKTFPTAEFTVAYWVGDGGLGIYSAEQSVVLLGSSDSGEYAGQTRFLDKKALERDDVLKRLRFNSQDSFTALILMTDGITDPLFETDNNLRDLTYWQKLWQQIQPKLAENPKLTAQNLTDWLDFWSQGNHDDRTIALIYH
jgi:serine/threonine protein phosphatase PrpC